MMRKAASSQTQRRGRRGASLGVKLLAGATVLLGGMAAAYGYNARRRQALDGFGDSLEQDDLEEAERPAGAAPLQPVAAGSLPRRVEDKTEASRAQMRIVSGSKGIYLRKEAAAAIEDMIAAARADGIPAPLLNPVSGYRSPKRQQELYAKAQTKYRALLSKKLGREPTGQELEKEVRRWVAKPGNSTHQTGFAADLDLGTPIKSEAAPQARETAAFQWLLANSERFGYVNYEDEPWHYEYTRSIPT